ncbi:MAG: diacylglycerol kinase family protein, partial [Planctomycetota bacterium]
MNPRQTQVIVFTSPKAGSGAGRHEIPRLRQLLEQSGLPHRQTSEIADLDAISEPVPGSESPTVVVAAGGDGTLSLVASRLSRQTPIVPMPMGTENLLARLLGQTNRAEDVLSTIRAERSIVIDAGEANGRLFLIMATIGFDAEVVRAVHLRRRGHIRRLAYALPFFRLFGRYRYPRLRLLCDADDGQPELPSEAAWVMLFNLPCYAAGLRIQPRTDANDGKLDAVLFQKGGSAAALRYLAAVGLRQHQRFRDVSQQLVSNVKIECDRRVAYQLDG